MRRTVFDSLPPHTDLVWVAAGLIATWSLCLVVFPAYFAASKPFFNEELSGRTRQYVLAGTSFLASLVLVGYALYTFGGPLGLAAMIGKVWDFSCLLAGIPLVVFLSVLLLNLILMPIVLTETYSNSKGRTPAAS
jgi:hypothetical protein